MTETHAKPSIEEMTGRAVHASVLVIQPRESESALLRVAAMAGAGMAIAERRDRAPRKPEGMSDELWGYGKTLLQMTPSTRDRVEAELAVLLLRIRNGRDHSAASLLRARGLLALWMLQTATWQSEVMRVHHAQIESFAQQCLAEWLADKCQQCGGTGQQELLRGGRTRRPRLFDTGRARLVTCRACHGSCAAQPDIRARVKALGIDWVDYKNAGWPQQFSKARHWLVRIAQRINTPLRKQLER